MREGERTDKTIGKSKPTIQLLRTFAIHRRHFIYFRNMKVQQKQKIICDSFLSNIFYVIVFLPFPKCFVTRLHIRPRKFDHKYSSSDFNDDKRRFP